MLKIQRNSIYLTRGDTAFIVVKLKDESGSPYIPEDGDHVYFRVKESLASTELLIEKECSIMESEGETTIQLDLGESDTENLIPAVYRYEIEVVTAMGYHFTAIANSNFEIGAELEVRLDG